MQGRMNGVLRQLFANRILFFGLLAMLLAACAAPPPPVAIVGDAIRVENPMARPAGVGQNSAAYLTVVNPTDADDHLLSVTGDVAAAVELHETVNDNGVMRMTPHADGFAIPAGSSVELKPGGKHVMLMGLHRDLAAGQEIVLHLAFAKAGEMQVKVPVVNK